MDANKKINPAVLCQLVMKPAKAVAIVDSFRGIKNNGDIICATYLAGQCTFKECKRAHLYCNESRRCYGETYANTVGPGVPKYLTEDRE